MSLASYVARRLMYDVCEIVMPVLYSTHYETVYNELCNFMERFTQHSGRDIIPNLPSRTESAYELREDMLDFYEGILRSSNDTNSILTLSSLFIITYYMMVKYSDDPVLCSNISFKFEVTTESLGGWMVFDLRRDSQETAMTSYQ